MQIRELLNSAFEYEDGELEIETSNGLKNFKLNAGGTMIYLTTKLHRVNSVTACVGY